MFSRHALRRTSLLALLALLWGLVFPALANAGVGNTKAVWTEVCTAQGIKQVASATNPPNGDEQTDPALAHHGAANAHCVLCCAGGSLPIAKITLLLDVLSIQAQAAVFPAYGDAISQPVILLNAPPRAPPVFIL